MDLRSAVESAEARLSPADRRVLEVLLSHPTEAAFLSAEEVAARAGVHQAQATRLAKKLGYPGYPGLRAALQGRLLGGAGAAERVRRRLEHTDGDVLAALAADEAAMLDELPRHVTQAQLDEAASRVLAARTVFLFARGNATVLVELLERRLRRCGIVTARLTGPGRDLAEQLLTLDRGDVLLAFAFLRPPASLPALLAAAAGRGAESILVTDTLESAVRPAPTQTLAAPRGSGREFQSLTVPMALSNALVLTIAREAPERSMSALGRLDDLLATFDT
jgi:DNA-binding MurR/RpiR family transcriptional regulator